MNTLTMTLVPYGPQTEEVTLVVHLAGSFSTLEAEEFSGLEELVLERVDAEGAGRVVVDFAQASMYGTALLAMLVRLVQSLRRRGCVLVVRNDHLGVIRVACLSVVLPEEEKDCWRGGGNHWGDGHAVGVGWVSRLERTV